MKPYTRSALIWRLFFVALVVLAVWPAAGWGRIPLEVASRPGGAAAAQAFDFFVEWAAVAETGPGTAEGNPSSLPLAVLWLEPKAGYHTYSHQPGGSAFPTVISLALAEPPEGAAPSAPPAAYQVRYLPGKTQADLFEPESTVRIYDQPTPFFLVFTSGTVPDKLTVQVSLLACSTDNCTPVTLALPLPARPESSPRATAFPWFALFEESRLGNGGPIQPQASGSGPILFFPTDSGDTPTSDLEANKGLPELTPIPFQESLEVNGLGKALLFGLLAGFILNVMPCVLPVLSLKISALLAVEGSEKERLRTFREHNLLFAAGILTWFAALAVLFGALGLAWGQIFQNSTVVFAMLLLVFCLGLAMFDVFHLPVLDLRVGVGGSPRVQAYTTGLLATLLATPCSGPLLGGVLGWSLMQSLPVLMTVFLATGLGMALPYLLMAWKPAFANRLPRAGAWMQTFERVLGFFLMGTAVYLLSILPAALVLPTVSLLLVVAVLAWIWGKWGGVRGSALRNLLFGISAMALLGWGTYRILVPQADAVQWVPLQEETFLANLGEKNLIVEFTADWCPTCKILERTTLTAKNVAPLAREYDAVLVRVDMTEPDPFAQELLRELNSASIPLLAVFPKGSKARQPVLLRDIYSLGQMRGAVHAALGHAGP